MRPEAMLGRIQAADRNKDGKLSKEEAPGPLKQHFERVDANKDGQLEPNELKKAGEAIRQHMRATFAKRRPEAAKRLQEARKKAGWSAKPMPGKTMAKKPQMKKPVPKKPKEKKAKAKKPIARKARTKKPIDKKVEAKK